MYNEYPDSKLRVVLPIVVDILDPRIRLSDRIFNFISGRGINYKLTVRALDIIDASYLDLIKDSIDCYSEFVSLVHSCIATTNSQDAIDTVLPLSPCRTENGFTSTSFPCNTFALKLTRPDEFLMDKCFYKFTSVAFVNSVNLDDFADLFFEIEKYINSLDLTYVGELVSKVVPSPPLADEDGIF